MNPLDIAEAARVAECGRYRTVHHPDSDRDHLVEYEDRGRFYNVEDVSWAYHGTQAECDAWIARRGNVAFVKALADWFESAPIAIATAFVLRAALLSLAEAQDG